MSSSTSSFSATTGSSSSSSSPPTGANQFVASLLAAFHGSGLASTTGVTSPIPPVGNGAGSSSVGNSTAASHMTWSSMLGLPQPTAPTASSTLGDFADDYEDDGPYDGPYDDVMDSESLLLAGMGKKKQKLSKGGIGYGGDAASDKNVLLRGRQKAAQKEAEEDKKMTDYLLRSKADLTAYLDRHDLQSDDDDDDDDDVEDDKRAGDAVETVAQEKGEKKAAEAMSDNSSACQIASKEIEEEKKEDTVVQAEEAMATDTTTTEAQEKTEPARVTPLTEHSSTAADVVVGDTLAQMETGEVELVEKNKPKCQDVEVDLTAEETEVEVAKGKRKRGPESWMQDLVRTLGKVFRNSVPTDWDQRLALYEAALECCCVLAAVPPPSISPLDNSPPATGESNTLTNSSSASSSEKSATTAEPMDHQPAPETAEAKRLHRRRQHRRRRHTLLLNGLFGDAEDAESLLAALDEFAQHATMMVSHAVDHEKPPVDGALSALDPPQPPLPKKRGRKRGRKGKATEPDTETGATIPTTTVGNVLPLAKRVLEVQNEAHEASKRAMAAFQEEEEELLAVMDTSDYYRKTLGPLRFALVPDLPGHYYANKELGTPNVGGGSRASSLRSGGYRRSSSSSSQPNQVPRDLRRLFRELTSYQTCLPVEHGSAIFVRVKEDRLDLLRALITGPEGTPYANGCLIFDIWLPPTYPQVPPQVHLMTTGGNTVRFNPNLYNCGKVCLSLLGTWSGPGWVPGESTLLQVLVSIQSLILVPDPYFNEPGYEASQSTARGQHLSEDYNRRIRRHTARWCIADFLQFSLMGDSSDAGTTPPASETTLPSSTLVNLASTTGMPTSLGTAAASAPPVGRQNPYPEFTEVFKKHFRYKRLAIERQLMAWMELECGDDASAAAKFWFPVQNEIVLRLHTLAPSRPPPPPPPPFAAALMPKTRTLEDGVIEVLEDDDEPNDDDDDVIEVVEPFDSPPTKDEKEQVVVEIDD